ncbi:SGNH/GDSL hydrolase family protein [Tsukamurella sp. M9C]|uniref:SGNH/GDSL hydrolase family protein n=1 Tax=Tsukamurella sp. M9C TaxID=2877520 RepID=UPI001CD0199F|nr:SGNH/GDSL hydrolase family protein [Tsukamurella sp. M9C]MCA0154786.1 SGNH/GDSL hydrolase family protein [Tsukamurella sp. M9C]
MSMRARPSLSLLGAAVLATTAVIGGAPAHAAPATPSYVALGDSYSSLPADATVGASQQERACGRSTHNYPKLVAASLGLAPDALRDNTCGGAKTRDAFASQHAGSAKTGYYDAAPQLDGITPATTLVTVSLGGNDGDLYSSILESCAVAPRSAAVRCTADQRTRPARLSDGAVASRLAKITAANERIIRAVRERSPRARILVVGYPAVFAGDRTCATIAPFRSASIPWMRSILTERLNGAVRRAAVNARAEYVDMEAPSKGHELCSARPWINGVDEVPRAAALHPFPEEGEAVATAVTAAVRASGPRP